MSIMFADKRRLRAVARRDFTYIYRSMWSHSKIRIPRGRLLDDFARTFGTPQFDGMKWHLYANRINDPKPMEEERLRAIAREYRVSRRLVTEIRKAIEK